MYNSKEMTVDTDLTFLSYNQTINAEFRVEDLLTSPLWVTNDDNGLVKAVPLFNCDKIVSSNSNDKVIDNNKCVILENIDNTLIQCISEDTGAIHYYSVELYAYAPYTALYGINEFNIYCKVYDEYLNTLNNVEVEVYVDNTLTDTVITDNQGIANFKVNNECNVYFKYGETESNIINIHQHTFIQCQYTGSKITLAKYDTSGVWLSSNSRVVIDWGDGTTSTVNNPTVELTHYYIDGQSEHTITFAGDVTGFGWGCFSYCSGLTSITIPDSVTSLGDGCFYSCTGLTSITIPDSVTSLGSSCFNGCTGLTSITIPDSVTSLGEECFKACTGLTEVSIPDSVISLGEECFRYCTGLVDYQLYWTGEDIILYGSDKMPNNADTIFTIPYGETSNYIAKNYPSSKLVEREE